MPLAFLRCWLPFWLHLLALSFPLLPLQRPGKFICCFEMKGGELLVFFYVHRQVVGTYHHHRQCSSWLHLLALHLLLTDKK